MEDKMRFLKLNDFRVDSHIRPKMALTAMTALDRAFGDKGELGDDLFCLVPGATPDYCGWRLHGHWGHASLDGHLTIWDGRKHRKIL